MDKSPTQRGSQAKKDVSSDLDDRKMLDKIIKDWGAGEKIPTLSPEDQEAIYRRLSICEAFLNDVFSTAIPNDHKNIARTTIFLDTPDFFERIVLDGQEVPKVFDQLLPLITDTLNGQGVRTLDGKTVVVHTTIYNPKSEPRRVTVDEAFFVARHEIVHGKVEPKIVDLSPHKQERKTGCKTVLLEDGRVIEVKHSRLYEAQTDALAVASSHPEVHNWNELFHLYLREQAEGSTEYAFQMSALTRLLALAFPDFFTGLTALGESYFRSDGEGFFSALRKGVEEATGVQDSFSQFLAYSEADNAAAMTQEVSRIIDIVKQT